MDWISFFGTSMIKNYINWPVSFLWKARMMWYSRSSFFLFFIFLLAFTMYLVFYGTSQWLFLKTLTNDIAHLENKNAIVIKENNNEKNQYEILLEKLPLYRSAANELDKLRTLAENRSVLIASAQYDLEKHSDELLVLRINQQLVSNYLKIRGYLSDVQSANSNVAIAQISFQRPEIKNEQIKASIVFLLYFKNR